MSSWSDREWIRKPRRGLEYVAARAPVVKRAYWRYAPEYYRWWIRRRMCKKVDFEAPLDPIKIVSVDPDLISCFTGRENADVDRWKSVGKIKGGDWDKHPPFRPDKPRYLQKISTADRIEDTTLYKSIKRHFIQGVPWMETELFDQALRGIKNGHTVLRSNSKKELLQRCEEIDSLYSNIESNGYKTQFELSKSKGVCLNRVGYLDFVTDEITVDVGRKGKLLFVDGRHRLSIAKVLGLSSVPVSILVRHKKWIEQRDELYTNGVKDPIHPDLCNA